MATKKPARSAGKAKKTAPAAPAPKRKRQARKAVEPSRAAVAPTAATIKVAPSPSSPTAADNRAAAIGTGLARLRQRLRVTPDKVHAHRGTQKNAARAAGELDASLRQLTEQYRDLLG